jgi:hypothetical protein
MIPKYNLYQLGWNDFQQLCLTIIREVLSQTVESFLDSNDAGQDGAFAGIWNPNGGENISGRFVIQCKFTIKDGMTLKSSDLLDEIPKAKRLVNEGLCDCYVLMTNAGLSGQQSMRIKSLFKGVGVKHVLIYGSSWICQQIQENKRLRMLVPRIYGLGDLSEVLDERAYSQARSLLESLREDLSKVVVTSAYQKAATALDTHGFVLLIGEPAAGKTTIASLLAMAALDQWGAFTLKLDDPSNVIQRWNPDNPSQFFWVDDAFGVTQYESYLVHGWNHVLPQIRTMLRKGAKIVMTSRDYIYNRARKDLKEGAFPLLSESQVVIDVHDLSVGEKRQILYNHLKLGRQPGEFRTAIKPYLEYVADHPRFIPETARRLADPIFTDSLSINRYGLEQFTDKQDRFLQDVLRGLDDDTKAGLALIYMRNDELESPVEIEESERNALDRLGSTLGGCLAALEAMNGGLAQHTHLNGSAVWRFRHPTIGDAFSRILIQSPELLGIYVQGSPSAKLVGQVTCGDVGMEHAVAIPKTLFPLMLERLRELSTEKHKSWHQQWEARRHLFGFLTTRCSAEFLSLYINRYQEILDSVSQPGLMLSAVPEVHLAVRLHELSLLPEDRRKMFVSKVTEYAVEGEDLYALDSPQIRKLFTDDEFEELRTRIENELLPKISEVRHDWQSNRGSTETEEERMEPLLESFRTLKREFGSDPEIGSAIELEIHLAEEWISDHREDEPKDKPERKLGNVQSSDRTNESRSIFDDIDK